MDNVVQTTAEAVATGDMSTIIYMISAFGVVYLLKTSIDLWKVKKDRESDDDRAIPKLCLAIENLNVLVEKQTATLERIEQRMERQMVSDESRRVIELENKLREMQT